MTTKFNDGGPAFPVAVQDGNECGRDETGLTIRDYFAAHAPPMPDSWASYRRLDLPEHEADAAELQLGAQWRFAFADAMLAARGGDA